jgi:hypothetical protein
MEMDVDHWCYFVRNDTLQNSFGLNLARKWSKTRKQMCGWPGWLDRSEQNTGKDWVLDVEKVYYNWELYIGRWGVILIFWKNSRLLTVDIKEMLKFIVLSGKQLLGGTLLSLSRQFV